MKFDDLLNEYSPKAAGDAQKRAKRPVQTRHEPARTAKHPPKKPKKPKKAKPAEAKPVAITDPKELEETMAWLALETGIAVGVEKKNRRKKKVR